jgi:thiol-disulfide isomerase/thioredoxin
MNTNIVIGGIIIILAIVGAIALGMSTDGTAQNQTGIDASDRATTESEIEVTGSEESMSDGMEDSMMDDAMEGEDMSADQADAAANGSFETYSDDKLAMAADGDVVLFFKASWCPSCRALENDIRANLDNIPADLTILEVDFDSSTELKQQYGVTTQHTLVQIDQNGQQINKWLGGNTLDTVVSNVI